MKKSKGREGYQRRIPEKDTPVQENRKLRAGL